jgi:ribosome-associated translation inhibitor RaiA
MLLPLQIAARGCELAPAAEDMIRRQALKLDSFYDRIVACRVMVETPHRRHRQGARYSVRLDLTIPRGELVVRKTHVEVQTAIQEAFDAAERRVKDHARVQRRGVKASQRRGALSPASRGDGDSSRGRNP